MHRTQIYVGDDQRGALARLAADRGVTASALIRDAIDAFLAAQSTPEERLSRLRALSERLASGSAAIQSSKSDGRAFVDGLRSADAGRLDSAG